MDNKFENRCLAIGVGVVAFLALVVIQMACNWANSLIQF